MDSNSTDSKIPTVVRIATAEESISDDFMIDSTRFLARKSGLTTRKRRCKAEQQQQYNGRTVT